MNHFRSSIHRILGLALEDERRWGAYPISIDTPHFMQLAGHPETLKCLRTYQEIKGEKKWILGVDRLDYIKGLVLKLRAFKRYLRLHPEMRGKVQMLQVVIPSRTDVPDYLKLKSRIEQLVSGINGEFSTPTWTPITYMFHSVNPHELSALYQLSEVMHIGSRRDGMNLVCLEYIASQQRENPGVVLLSEFAGAHSTLTYAVSINPWNIEDTAEKLHGALTQPLEQRQREMHSMQEFLKRYNSSEWARIFLRDLDRSHGKREEPTTLSRDGNFPWLRTLRDKRVVLFCDLDGTLAPIRKLPSEVQLQDHTIELLKKIAHTDCHFVVVSGRDKEFLEGQFMKHQFDFPLAACHGAYAYEPEEKRWEDLVTHDPSKWSSLVLDILKLYTSRTPGSFIEDKGHAVTWHYRNSPEQFADFLANKLFFELEEALTNCPVQVHRGKKVIEVKSITANKGYFVRHWINKLPEPPEVVVAIGDDTTDEDMFAALMDFKGVTPYCVKVGREKSHANYAVSDQQSVNLFLENFLENMGAQ
jgi:trehalose 6-phosphate synthase/phosphatase